MSLSTIAMRASIFFLLGASWCCQFGASHLSSDETEGVIRLAREYRRGSVGEKTQTKAAPDLEKASQLYKTIIEQGQGPSHVDAFFELASINTQSPTDNFVLLSKASEYGHAMAQHQLSTALFTGVGVGGLVPRDPGRALMLEQFSALSGTPEAHLGMGYRYMMGEGVPKSCESALPYLEFAANEAAWQKEERGHNLFSERSYLAKEVEAGLAAGGAVHGEITTDMVNYYEHLASENDQNAVQALAQIYAHGSNAVPVDMVKVMKYLHIAATDLKVSVAAGQLGYLLATRRKRKSSSTAGGGGGGGDNDEEERIAEGNQIAELLQFSYDNHDSWGVLGMGYCFYMGGCGGGIDRNITRALESFQRVHSKHPEAAFYIGELLMGMGGLYEMSELAAEGVNHEENALTPPPTLAEIQVDVASAFQFYSSASARGHVLATHRLGHIQAWGGAVIEERADRASIASDRAKGIVGSSYAQKKANRRGRGGAAVPRSCESAAAAFKSVAERGDWSLQLNTAHTLYSAGDRCGALRLFSQLAAMGYETAQANAAFILSQSPPACPAWISPETSEALAEEADEEVSSVALLSEKQWAASRNFSEFMANSGPNSHGKIDEAKEGEHDLQGAEKPSKEYGLSDLYEARALSLYRQSALLGNAGSFRKMGDLHYYGSGGLATDKHEAALLYQLAADYGQTHAMFNLGVMHEMGDGVEQDFHLAKRYYDQTAEYDPSARVPSRLAVYFLRAHKEFQQRMGKETTDKVGAAVMQVISPLLQMSDLKSTMTTLLFPERNTSDSAAMGAYQVDKAKNEALSPVALLLWKVKDKMSVVWHYVVSSFHGVSEYLFRFSARFSKSPQQAISSLLHKASEVVNGEKTKESTKDKETSSSSPPASQPSTDPSLLPSGNGVHGVDAEAEEDFELILLLTLLFILVVLVDERRHRARAVRRNARERRRQVWNNVTVFEIRDLIRSTESKKED